METEILKLIYDYSIQGKLVDYYCINKIIDIVVSTKNINNYVKDLIFTNELEKSDNEITFALYNYITKTITIDYESIQIIIEKSKRYDYFFESFEQSMFENLTIIQIILHELEHAYQNKQADDKSDNSIEAKLASTFNVLKQILNNPALISDIIKEEISKENIMTYIFKTNELYNQYYKLNPNERLAEIKSYKTIIDSIIQIKDYIPKLYDFEMALLLEKYLQGYKEAAYLGGCCPTQAYLFGTRQEKIWTELDFYNANINKLIRNVYNNYNLEERLKLGLPITDEEYNSVEKMLINKF